MTTDHTEVIDADGTVYPSLAWKQACERMAAEFNAEIQQQIHEAEALQGGVPPKDWPAAIEQMANKWNTGN